MSKIGDPVCVAPTGDRCGEGAVWHETEQALYWCDINRFLIHRLEPNDGSVRSWFFDEVVSTIALTDREDTLAVALGSRLDPMESGYGCAAGPRISFRRLAASPSERRACRSAGLVVAGVYGEQR